MKITQARATLGSVALGAVLLLGACGEDETPPSTPTTSEVPAPTSTTSIVEPTTTTEAPATTTTTEATTPDADVDSPEDTEAVDPRPNDAEPQVSDPESVDTTPDTLPPVVPVLLPPPPCSTWTSQAEANEWMAAHGDQHDTSTIDTDGDGQPCELSFLPPPTVAPAPAPASTPTPPEAFAPASGACWDCLAQCESGGNWSINTGTGFTGGLQFHWQTWNAYGGQQYAAEAWMAPKWAQIAVAELVLADVGRGAWPGCTAAGRW